LKLSPAEEVIPEDETTDVVRFNPANAEVADQRLIVREFDFRVEINTDESSKPMVQLESSFGADVLNWSKSLSATAFMKLKASYYNQQYRIWEPLIEPVFHPETESEDKWKSWQLNLSANASDNIKLPKMSVSITSDEPLELTVTKGFIELSNQISESFQRAAKQIAPPKSLYQLPGTGPYVVVNQLDIPLSLTRSNILNVSKIICPYRILFLSQVENGISCKQGEPVDLSIRQTHRRTSSGLSEQRNGIFLRWKFRELFQRINFSVEITVALLDTERDINISRVQKHCVPLPKIADSGFQWILLTDIISEHSRYLVTLRSLVSVSV
jgi:hypothetical protein